MIQRIIDIKSNEQLVFDKSTQKLILCIENGRLTIASLNQKSGGCAGIEVFQFSKTDLDDIKNFIDQVKQQSSLIHLSTLDTIVYHRTPNTMLIPTSLTNSCNEFIEAQFGHKEREQVISEIINSDISIAWKTSDDLILAFNEIFQTIEWRSSLGLLVRSALEATKHSSVIQLLFGDEMVELTITKNGQLLLAKCFEYNAIEDMNYHLLNGCRQLNISPSEVFVKVQGLIENNSPLLESVKKYFLNVELDEADIQNWSEQFKQIPSHYFTSLIR